MAVFVFTIGGFKLAISASRELSALLGKPVTPEDETEDEDGREE